MRRSRMNARVAVTAARHAASSACSRVGQGRQRATVAAIASRRAPTPIASAAAETSPRFERKACRHERSARQCLISSPSPLPGNGVGVTKVWSSPEGSMVKGPAASLWR